MIVFLVGNTSWKRWKCHLRDSRFQNFLRGWGGVGWGGLLFFISNLNWLIINSTVLFKKWDLLEFLWGKAIFGNVKRLNLFCFRGLCPLDPQRGSAPVPRPGPRQPPNTSPVERLLAPIAVYFQNISTYFKSYWQPWFTEISSEVKWGKDTGRQLENPPYHICPSSDTQQLRSPWKFSRIHWSLCHLWLSFSSLK